MTLTSPRRNGRVSETFCCLPPESDCTGCSIDAREGAEELHLAVTLRARDPEDLALLDVEVDRAEAVSSQARDRKEDLAGSLRAVSLRKRRLQRPPDHERDK